MEHAGRVRHKSEILMGNPGYIRGLPRQVSAFLMEMAAHPHCVVGMEAGSGAHHWGRCLTEMGHDVRLMPPRYVRPYVKGNTFGITKRGNT